MLSLNYFSIEIHHEELNWADLTKLLLSATFVVVLLFMKPSGEL